MSLYLEGTPFGLVLRTDLKILHRMSAPLSHFAIHAHSFADAGSHAYQP